MSVQTRIMKFLYLKGAVFFPFIPVVLNLRLMDNGRSLNCTREEVQCTAEFNNCLYKEWLIPSDFTPSEPDDLSVYVDVRSNMKGDVEPVIVAEWKAKDDGSIIHLKGTELAVLKSSTNEHLCVHYKFLQVFKSMRNSVGEKWSFSLDKVVVDPDSTYVVTVSNLPKPNLQHTSYNINLKVNVPGCDDLLMRTTKICFERGDTWRPNVTVGRTTDVNGKDILYVAFNPGENAEKYNVFLKCNRDTEMKTLYNESNPLLNVTYNLENWSRTCCNFDVQIQPFFRKCANDCRRKNHSFNICGPVPTSPPENNSALQIICAGLCLLICAIGICAIYLRCRKPQNGQKKPQEPPRLVPPVSSGPRSVLIIYSRDHPLYTDIVLKLCAFLRAKCGIEVMLDLLDTTWLGTIGRLQWLEEKKRQIEQSSNKILVLCSRGVQAKWGAMCGEPRILLREDVRSPVGDMLTLALQLITPDMQRPASYGKYLVAYFDDVSSEGDVPSMFDIAVKYKLMKHFEELYFRILDVEKYQQGVKHCIEGIGKDEYFNCPSGEALRNAIEAFQAHQLKNQDWFEKECVTSEEEVRGETDPLLEMPMQPIYELTPMLNIGLPILVKEVDINQEPQSVCSVSPQIQENPEVSSVVIINPRVQPDHSVLSYYPPMECPLELPSVTGIRTPMDPQIYPCFLAEPGPVEPSHPPFAFPLGEPSDNCPTDSRKCFLIAPPPSMEDSFNLNQEMDMSQPLEMEESEMEGASETRPSRGSDQGYGSRYSTVREDPKFQQDCSSLAKLQMHLFQNSPISSSFCTSTTEI
ncbi:interleukin-17 receptor A-like [Sinocyclocheilus anshuiensis]|uniref:interleukin-17 receptor A-like n=1 Tax=Sinocyclocheilus anshuiensis TaxID=1608454 RepID=UPI0007B97FC4|nr:PREDICTED: interleukin-17 receptor A-like [Sinocyclocheilus anshuiensis]